MVWCADISYIPTKEGFVYLSVIKGLYDNFIVEYKVGTENNKLVYETVKATKKRSLQSCGSTVTKPFNTLQTGILS